MTNLSLVSRTLKKRYGNFAHFNKSNPLDELIFILLSITTTEPVYRRTFKTLKAMYRSHATLESASMEKIAMAIREGGQYKQKSLTLKNILRMLTFSFGRPTLAPIKHLRTRDAENFLTSLPGIGKKVARCILMYSLHRKVFPVDTHCLRIGIRLGLLTEKEAKLSYAGDILQSRIPLNLRFALHVNFVSLGREFCRAIKPKCESCPISELCPKMGWIKKDLPSSEIWCKMVPYGDTKKTAPIHCISDRRRPRRLTPHC
jgi:endonuclease III